MKQPPITVADGSIGAVVNMRPSYSYSTVSPEGYVASGGFLRMQVPCGA